MAGMTRGKEGAAVASIRPDDDGNVFEIGQNVKFLDPLTGFYSDGRIVAIDGNRVEVRYRISSWSDPKYNQVISIDKLLPDMKFGKARTNAAKANLPDEAPQLPDEGSRDADRMYAAETLTLLKGTRSQSPPSRPQRSSAEQDSVIADDAPSIITIVITVQEEKTASRAKRPRVDDAVHIKAQAEALAKASDHFRAIIQGAAEGATAPIIHVEVSAWKEFEALHRIVRVAQEEDGDYCTKAGAQMSAEDLLQTILVARKFMFRDCLKQCAARVAQKMSEADAMTLIMGLTGTT